MRNCIIEPSWDIRLDEYLHSTRFSHTMEEVYTEYDRYTVYPHIDDMFQAFELTPFDKVKVVIMGQDPYIREGQAHGLAFSVLPGVRIPPSLLNIFKEIRDDIGYEIPDNGCLIPWAEQGVLLLNSSLTVREGKSGSHKNIGWNYLIQEVITALDHQRENLVFMLWGKQAQSISHLIDHERHYVLEAAYPGPLSGGMPFFGCKHFSKCNEFLYEVTDDVICWQIPNIRR